MAANGIDEAHAEAWANKVTELRPGQSAKPELAERFQLLINGIGDLDLGIDGLEAIELVVQAKTRIWKALP